MARGAYSHLAPTEFAGGVIEGLGAHKKSAYDAL